MPTGYTAKVEDGTMTKFRDYALTCARAFGALIMLRDDPLAPAPRDTGPRSTYHDEALARARAALAGLETMSYEDIEAGCTRDHAAQLSSWRQRRLERERERQNYLSMLAKVERWTPPTSDHIGLKEFMAQQIHESMKYWGDEKEPPARTPTEWHADALSRARRDVDYHEKEMAKEIERHNERNKWLADLHASLPLD